LTAIKSSYFLVRFFAVIICSIIYYFNVSMVAAPSSGIAHNGPPAAAGRALLGVDFVFVFSSFYFLPLALDHLARLEVAGMLVVMPSFAY